MKNNAGTTVYREFLWPSINTFMAIAIIGPTVWLTLYPWNRTLGIWLGLLVTLSLLVLVLVRAQNVEVTQTELRVGTVRIPRSELGTSSAISGEEARLERGPRLHPQAFLLLRGTSQKLVKVELHSAQDPTPYWLFSSRHPDRVVEALAG
jgi:hypothetical protein